MSEKTKENLLIRLSANLISEGLVTSEQLSEAKRVQSETGQTLGKTLVSLNYLSEEELIAFVAKELDIPHMDLSGYVFEPEVIDLIPEATARKYRLVPMFRIEDTLTVAMADPLDIFALDDIKLQVGLEIIPALASEEDILKAINQYYGGARSIAETIEEIEEPSLVTTTDEGTEDQDLEKVTEKPTIVRLVNQLILEATRDRASDIHLEPRENEMSARYRIDGTLHEVSSIPKNLQLPVISRVKIMADLDITERRIPQDGRIQLKLKEKEIELRVSTFPTIFGEKIVMRILDKSAVLFDLDALGFSSDNLKKFKTLISEPNGLILVTGPTGSGKSATLYAALTAISSAEKNIVTLEDPVEHTVNRANQAGINPKGGLTFATGLRSILRQDPDIIMVGEMRDIETCKLAIRAALTGHLVFSTLHTMDAAGSLTRILDMGIEPFLISSSVIGVLAQRLVRIICPNCKEEYIPRGWPQKKDIRLYRGRGCQECRNTGYKGRTGLFEIIVINDHIRELIMKKAHANLIKKVAEKDGTLSLREDGIKKAEAGITTIEEVLRVT